MHDTSPTSAAKVSNVRFHHFSGVRSARRRSNSICESLAAVYGVCGNSFSAAERPDLFRENIRKHAITRIAIKFVEMLL